MLKKFSIIALLLALVLVLVGCAPKAPQATATPVPATEAPATAVPATDAPAAVVQEPAEAEGLELTVEELAQYNGKDGQKAYIAVDGIVYDVTNSAVWKNGQHNGFEAGKDLTAEIKDKSPHGVAKLDNVVEIGKLVTE